MSYSLNINHMKNNFRITYLGQGGRENAWNLVHCVDIRLFWQHKANTEVYEYIIQCSPFLSEICKWKPIYLKDSDNGVRVPSPLSTTRKKFKWSPSRYTKNVTCLLQEVFSQTSSRLESMYSAISLSGSSIGTTNRKIDKQAFNLIYQV